jgi:SAM-dependent methyltransferase
VATLGTWEEAVLALRLGSDQQGLVRACYYDDPLLDAASRFHTGPEWSATRELVGNCFPADVLDLGAGRGIASYAFASDGCRVTALEPDESDVVGRGAIAALCEQSGLDIRAVAGHGELLPFPDRSFDIVYARAVLHHARDLSQLCRETARVLRPGGIFLAVREHVITRSSDLPLFLNAHPLHRLYGGEHAYRRSEYEQAILAAGFRLRRVFRPYDSPMNYWPQTDADLRQRLLNRLRRWLSAPVASLLLGSTWSRHLLFAAMSRWNNTPGRHFSFLGVKP